MFKIMTLKITLMLLLFGFLTSPVSGSLFYYEANLISGYSDQEGMIYSITGQRNSIGFEYLEKLSNDYGDYLSFNLQSRFSFDLDNNTSEKVNFEIHNAFLTYNLGLGLNFRLGHFAPSFGLESITDSHSTIFQGLNMLNIGFKKDWGVGLKGYIQDYDFEISAQVGSGMSIYNINDIYLFSTRISTSNKSGFNFGLSYIFGERLFSRWMSTIPPGELISNEPTSISRFGLDLSLLFGPSSTNLEFIYGNDNDFKVLSSLLNSKITFPSKQNLDLDFQFKYFKKENNDDILEVIQAGLGFSYKLFSGFEFRTAYFKDFKNMIGTEDDLIIFQFYYYKQ